MSRASLEEIWELLSLQQEKLLPLLSKGYENEEVTYQNQCPHTVIVEEKSGHVYNCLKVKFHKGPHEITIEGIK